jgi:spore coat protein U-like protein
MRTLAVATALLLASSFAAPAGAVTCQIDSITGLNFGSYNVFSSAALDSTGELSFTCTDFTQGDSVRIELGPGSAGSGPKRTLRNGAFVLEYNLYSDLGRTIVWGTGTEDDVSVLLESGGNEVDIFGRIEANQNAHTGAYTDNVLVTVVF